MAFLRGRGFGYEADRLDELTLAFEEQESATPVKPEEETSIETSIETARNIIRELLSTPELNDDKIDRETRDVISMARAFIEKP